MKKGFLISIIPIFIFLFPLGLIGGSFFLSGCTEETPDRFKQTQTPNGENLFSYSRYPYINQVFGYPVGEDFLRIFQTWAELGDNLAMKGQMTDEAQVMFYDMMSYLTDELDVYWEEYETTLEDEEVTTFSQNSDAIIDGLDIANYTGMGDVLNELFEQFGRDWLPHHLYPILSYYFKMPYDDVYKGLVDTINDNTDPEIKLSQAEFDKLIEILERMIDGSDDTYGPIWDAMPSSWDLIKTVKKYGDGYTVGELKEVIDSLLSTSIDPDEFEVSVDEDLAEALATAMDELWDEEDSIVIKHKIVDGSLVDLSEDEYIKFDMKGVIKNLIYSVNMMMTEKTNCTYGDEDIDNSCFNIWDQGDMTDLARVIHSLSDLLDPEILPRKRLQSFMDGLITASAAMDGADSINGILSTYYNPVYFAGFDDAVDYIFKHNNYNERRTDDGVAQISSLRVLLFLTKLFNLPMGNLANGALYSEDGMVNRNSMLDFAMGELATASADPEYDDPFKYVQYILFGKPYEISLWMDLLCKYSGLCPKYDGLFGMLESFEDLIMNEFVAGLLDNLMGLPLDSTLPAVYVAVGVDRSLDPPLNHRPGVTHQLLFFAQAIEHFYFKDHSNHDPVKGWQGNDYGWERALMDLVISMNEIDNSKYFNKDDGPRGVLQTVEGPKGYGLATYAVRSHGEGDEGLLDPVFYMLCMIVNKLQDEEYGDGTLWEALMDNMKKYKIDMMGYTVDIDVDYKEWVPDLFDEDEDSGKSVMDTTYGLLNDNKKLFITLAEDFGPVLNELFKSHPNPPEGEPDWQIYDQVFQDINDIIDIFDQMTWNTDDAFDSDGITNLTDYLFSARDDGSDNEFVANIKALLIKAMDLKIDDKAIVEIHNLEKTNEQNKAYYKNLYKNINEDVTWWRKESITKDKKTEGQREDYVGNIHDSKSLSDLFKHLFGEEEDDLEGGLYSISHVEDFVAEIQDSNIDLFSAYIEDGMRILWVDGGEDIISKHGKMMGPMKYIMWDIYKYKFVTPLFFYDVDINRNGKPDWTGAYILLSCWALETDMNGFLEDCVSFWGGPDLRPGGTSYSLWYEIFEFYANATELYSTPEEVLTGNGTL